MSFSVPRFLVVPAVAIGLFAVPVAAAQSDTAPARAHKGIGVGMQGGQDGIRVIRLAAGAPAEKAGVKIGDQVISIAGVPIREFDLSRMQSIADTARSISFVVMREGKEMTLQIVPGFVNRPSPSPGAGTPR